MESVSRVRGELINLGATFMFSSASYFLNLAIPARSLAFTGVPFAAWSILSGFTNVFWVSLAHKLLGKGYGVLTAVIASSLILLQGSWFGISYPPWYGAYGVLSYVVMGVLTEFVNGGLGNLACAVINWVALGITFGVWPSYSVVIIASATYVTGWLGSKLGGLVISKLLKLEEVKN